MDFNLRRSVPLFPVNIVSTTIEVLCFGNVTICGYLVSDSQGNRHESNLVYRCIAASIASGH
jgi:hypothetical protein